MGLKCPVCGAAIPAENINIQEMVALCDQCGHVFSFKTNTTGDTLTVDFAYMN
jgi:uncharacterized Zn finger protein